MSEQCHNVHKYLSIILHSCNSEVEYLTFPVILEHRSLHSTDEPALFTTKLSQIASLTSLTLIRDRPILGWIGIVRGCPFHWYNSQNA